MATMTDSFGKALMESGKNEKLVVINADLSNSTRTSYFASSYPERFFNVGIAEQDEFSMAAGLAIAGKIPVASTYAIFASRGWEQIRNTISRANLNVKIFATHAGLTDFGDGSSHQALEDIALFRALPNFSVLAPSDPRQTSILTERASESKGPVYARLARGETESIYSTEDFAIGKPNIIEDGKDVSIFACGLMVPKAIEARRMLKKDGVDAGVIDFHTIKPLDEKTVERAAKTGAIVTAEEHSVIGGLGSAIAECLAKKSPCPVEMVGIKDEFGTSGSLEELYEHFGLTGKHIANASKRALGRKDTKRKFWLGR
ncbi:MAG: transketolase family protein [Candidatus Aenigmarchaeota archaeon]|nr:transketolase family protein [Candidatus Aenigmarchaeota archaeon]